MKSTFKLIIRSYIFQLTAQVIKKKIKKFNKCKPPSG